MNSAFEFYHVLKRISYKCRQHTFFFFIFKSLLCKMLILDLVFSIFHVQLLGSSWGKKKSPEQVPTKISNGEAGMGDTDLTGAGGERTDLKYLEIKTVFISTPVWDT